MARLILTGLSTKRLTKALRIDQAIGWVEALVPRLVWAAVELLPTDAASTLGACLGRWVGPHLPHQPRVLRNLEVALPHLDRAARRALAREIWSEAGRILAEFPLFDRICGPEARERLEFVIKHDP